MTHLELLVAALGGPEVVGPIRTRLDLARLVREGLPFSSIHALAERAELGDKRLADVLGISYKTLTRRRASDQLAPAESDRLVRLADVHARAEEVLGSIEKANAWLARPSRALGGQPPLALLDTQPGTGEVLDLLGRIEHGLFA